MQSNDRKPLVGIEDKMKKRRGNEKRNCQVAKRRIKISGARFIASYTHFLSKLFEP